MEHVCNRMISFKKLVNEFILLHQSIPFNTQPKYSVICSILILFFTASITELAFSNNFAFFNKLSRLSLVLFVPILFSLEILTTPLIDEEAALLLSEGILDFGNLLVFRDGVFFGVSGIVIVSLTTLFSRVVLWMCGSIWLADLLYLSWRMEISRLVSITKRLGTCYLQQ